MLTIDDGPDNDLLGIERQLADDERTERRRRRRTTEETTIVEPAPEPVPEPSDSETTEDTGRIHLPI